MKFKLSAGAQEFIENVYPRVGARNKAVLGRSALFLALGEGVPPNFKPTDSQGVDLDDETVVGDELKDVVRAALNHRAGKTLDESAYRQAFRLHFEYGCLRLKQIWEESGNDQAKFVTELLRFGGDDLKLATGSRPSGTPLPIVETPVKLKLLVDSDEWTINEGGQNGLMIISGRPGLGKSQLALDLLAQISRQGVRFVFFDLKGELEDDPSSIQQQQNRTRFLQLTGAQYIRLIRQDLPINPLFKDPNPSVNTQLSYEIASLIRAFAPQLGARQERAISDAYQNLDAPDFVSLAMELEQAGANGVELALIRKIVDFNLFADARTAISPEEWLRQSIVIDFKEFGNDNDTKSLAVALILNFLMKRLNKNLAVKNGVQPLKMVLFVDEAHLLLPKEGKVGLLGSLARQGRSWGFPVWLASQDADAFFTSGANATNFAELAECAVHFSIHSLSESRQKQIIGGIARKLEQGEAVMRLKGKLQSGIVRQFWRNLGS